MKQHTIEYDGITVWNYPYALSSQIKDQEIREYISVLLKANCHLGKPIENIGVIKLDGNEDFRPLSPKEQNRIRELRIALFLSAMSASNIYHGLNTGAQMMTAENFTVVYQNFELGSLRTGYSSGTIVTMNDYGYEITKIKFEAPRSLVKNSLNLDDKLLVVMNKIKKKKPRQYRLLLRATEAMMNGYYNTDDISTESRILEQCRAFEILFSLPEKQRKYFKIQIGRYCQSGKEKKVRYKYETYNNKVWETSTKQVMWADRFYTLRNHIIHGKTIKPKEHIFLGLPHFTLGLWFFLVSVKKILNGLIGKELFYDTINYQSGKFKYDRRQLMPYADKLLRAIEKY